MNKTELPKQVGVQSAGFSLGVIVVWSLDTFVLAEPMPNTVAVAFGTVIAWFLSVLFPPKMEMRK